MCRVCVLQVTPLDSNGQPHGEHQFVRTGLIGFLGPVSAAASQVHWQCAENKKQCWGICGVKSTPLVSSFRIETK